MKSLFYIILFCSYLTSQSTKLINIDSQHLLDLIDSHKGKKAVFVNFWATWCAPCIKEFPSILNIQETYQNSVEVILVSFDFPQNRDRAVKFLKKKNVSFKTYFKNEEDEQFLNKMPDEWSGALPFTMIISKDGSQMVLLEDEQTYHTFETHVLEAIK